MMRHLYKIRLDIFRVLHQDRIGDLTADHTSCARIRVQCTIICIIVPDIAEKQHTSFLPAQFEYHGTVI